MISPIGATGLLGMYRALTERSPGDPFACLIPPRENRPPGLGSLSRESVNRQRAEAPDPAYAVSGTFTKIALVISLRSRPAGSSISSGISIFVLLFIFLRSEIIFSPSALNRY